MINATGIGTILLAMQMDGPNTNRSNSNVATVGGVVGGLLAAT